VFEARVINLCDRDIATRDGITLSLLVGEIRGNGGVSNLRDQLFSELPSYPSSSPCPGNPLPLIKASATRTAESHERWLLQFGSHF